MVDFGLEVYSGKSNTRYTTELPTVAPNKMVYSETFNWVVPDDRGRRTITRTLPVPAEQVEYMYVTNIVSSIPIWFFDIHVVEYVFDNSHLSYMEDNWDKQWLRVGNDISFDISFYTSYSSGNVSFQIWMMGK